MELAGVERGDAVLEIGPGTGALTRPLAEAARRVVALEVDRGLVALLAEAGLPANVEIRHADALRTDLAALARELGPGALLVGNLPYRVAGRLLGEVLGPASPFRRLAFMLQAEVADRLLAEPGSPSYGILSVWRGLWFRAWRALELGPAQFEPRPRVRSTFVVLEPAAPAPFEVRDPALLRSVVRQAFQHRRKTLRGALRGRVPGALPALAASGIDPARRAETLSAGDFARLSNALLTAAPRCD